MLSVRCPEQQFLGLPELPGFPELPELSVFQPEPGWSPEALQPEALQPEELQLEA